MTAYKTTDITLVKWTPDKTPRVITTFFARAAIDPGAEQTAQRILADVRGRGNRALVDYAAKFDGAHLTPATIRVRSAEILAAREETDIYFRHAVREAKKRIVTFAKAGMRQNWQIRTPRGGTLGEQFVPFDRIGAYIPGGAAPLASTALMTITLAKVAGVPEIVAFTPASADGRIDPRLLFAIDAAGATEIYKVGGIHAIGAMAYGTTTIRRVQKIVGPGGPYVTAAKRLVYGEVALDMVAGPSEIAILADNTASPAHVAADLLSQAEHGTGLEKALLVTSSAKLAESVRAELVKQTKNLSREKQIWRVLQQGCLLVVVNTLDDGMDLCNRFAAEHLELLVREPRKWIKKVRSAGAIFSGTWTPESAGDFVAGPSHVLPTGGTAAMFSGLTVDDFRRRSSVLSFTQADLKEVLPVIEAFGQVEGLDAHVRSAQKRFE